ncbi:helix-turn-helix domain-containing protein [Streptomyces triculaminicus]|uniref:helix-turn-helix domain-containing protein n=1 Tax=Streptomyces triculaminicus TaxID=2816232 RepID=UPI0037D71140
MPRPEKPVDYTVPEVGDLAAYLRARRAASGRTYAELAQGAVCSQATLKRAAAGGTRPPEWATVHQYLHLCGHPETREARALYKRAVDAAAAARRDARRTTVRPKPQYVRDLADLSGALRDAYRHAGRPPVRDMERRAGPGRLSRSTAHAMITARTIPKDIRTYLAFLETCEITGHALTPWFTAWAKAFGPERIPPAIFPTTPGERLFNEWAKKIDKPLLGFETPTVIDGCQRVTSLLLRREPLVVVAA